MHPHEHRARGPFRLALNDGNVFAAVEVIAIANRPELAKSTGQLGLGLAQHEPLGIEPVADQIGNVDEAQPVLLGVVHQLG